MLQCNILMRGVFHTTWLWEKDVTYCFLTVHQNYWWRYLSWIIRGLLIMAVMLDPLRITCISVILAVCALTDYFTVKWNTSLHRNIKNCTFTKPKSCNNVSGLVPLLTLFSESVFHQLRRQQDGLQQDRRRHHWKNHQSAQVLPFI